MTITKTTATTSLFERALVAAEAVGELYQATVDLHHALTPTNRKTLVRLTLEDWDDLLGDVHSRLSRTEYRMVVMFTLAHASSVHDDIEVRRELKTWLLPSADGCVVWPGREERSVWSRAAMGEALAVRAYFVDLTEDMGSPYPLDVVADEVAASVATRLLPYQRFLTSQEWDEVMFTALDARDPSTNLVVGERVWAHMVAEQVAA